MSLCRYKDLLGAPGQGLHRFQVGGVAVADVAASVVLALLVAWAVGFGWRSFVVALVAVLAVGVLLHRLFCVRTTVDRWIFG